MQQDLTAKATQLEEVTVKFEKMKTFKIVKDAQVDDLETTVVQTNNLLKQKEEKLEKFCADLQNLHKEVAILREATKSDIEVAKKLQGMSIVSANKSYLESEHDSKKSSAV